MLDIHSDVTLHCAAFGTHIEHLEVDELSASAIEVRIAEFSQVFEIRADCPAGDLAEAARTSVAIDRLVGDHRLGSLAYFLKARPVPRAKRRSLQSSSKRHC